MVTYSSVNIGPGQLTQVLACCLTASSHDVNHCWHWWGSVEFTWGQCYCELLFSIMSLKIILLIKSIHLVSRLQFWSHHQFKTATGLICSVEKECAWNHVNKWSLFCRRYFQTNCLKTYFKLPRSVILMVRMSVQAIVGSGDDLAPNRPHAHTCNWRPRFLLIHTYVSSGRDELWINDNLEYKIDVKCISCYQ